MPRDPLARPDEGVRERWASAGPADAPAPKWGLPQPVALVAMAGSGASPFSVAADGAPRGGLAALPEPTPVGKATPTPTPFPTAQAGCHQWRYTLHWDRPSRLATLKNALGNSVTIYKNYKAPGSGLQTDWPDPITSSVDWTGHLTGSASDPAPWNYKNPPAGATTFVYNHDCGVGLPACGPDEQPGISYAAGWADPLAYNPPGSKFNPQPGDAPQPYPNPPGKIILAGDPVSGEIVDWSWTLNYGYGKDPGNDIIYGPDPGPPFLAYDMTVDSGTRPAPFVEPGRSGVGGSIPGITGTPFPVSNGLNSPASWTTIPPKDAIGKTAELVNWGLYTFQDVSDSLNKPDWCAEPANYKELVRIQSNDSGDVSAIEDYMRLAYYSSGPHPGLSVQGGTPTKRAIELAGLSLANSWQSDPKKACARPWGVILCTDGLSSTCNTGVSPDEEWGYAGDGTPDNPPNPPPCESDVAGTSYQNYPPGAAENIYLNALTGPGLPGYSGPPLSPAFSGAAVIKPRTYAIGIAPEVGRCELNRVAYRGRTDASKNDAGFLLFDPSIVCDEGDADLPYINPDQTTPGLPTDLNHFRQDQTPPYDGSHYNGSKADYAFFGLDTLYDTFIAIVTSTARGDYSTSAPVGVGSSASGSNTSLALIASTDYPSWKGHFRQVDTTKDPADPAYVVWDAGKVLAAPSQPWQPTPATRAIYTWDPATGTLIPVDTNPANVAKISALSGSPGYSNAPNCNPTLKPWGAVADATHDPTNINCANKLIDFVRGNDGTLTNTSRATTSGCSTTGWMLGPIINATAGVVGPPNVYKQAGTVANHKPFETTYANRHTLVWVGSDDGLVHAFDFDDGTEVLALLPPNLLANQIDLFTNFTSGYVPGSGPNAKNLYPTGQLKLADQHIYGIANSFRFADVYFGTGYKTLGFLTEGPGGNLVAAIDITHPYPGRASTPAVAADPNYDPANPVSIVWTKNDTNYSGLHGGWSVPAIAADAFTTSRMFFGAGINPASLYNAQRDATLFIVDPTDGTLNEAQAIPASATPNPLVGQQTFADGVFFQTNVASYLPDNVANLDVQADLNGRAWFTWGNFAGGSTTSRVGIDLNYAAAPADTSGNQTPVPQPIYYSPAVTGQGIGGCQFYALASGSLYETSPTVSGWNVNRTGAPVSPFPNSLPSFTPYLYVGVNPYPITSGQFAQTPLGKFVGTDPKPMDQYILRQRIGGEVPEALDLPLGDPGFTETPPRTKLGIHTQVTSSPVMIVDTTGVSQQQALFLLYDPDAGCNGRSYIAILTFEVSTSCGRFKNQGFAQIQVYGAGPGAASGFTIAGGELFAAQSGVSGGSASLYRVNIPVNTLTGPPSFLPLWWRDVK